VADEHQHPDEKEDDRDGPQDEAHGPSIGRIASAAHPIR
jgi:hypothetical protein